MAKKLEKRFYFRIFAEYDKYKKQADSTLSLVEKDFIASLNTLETLADTRQKESEP